MANISAIDGVTGDAMKKTGECIVDMGNGLSASGHVEITENEDIVTIDDDSIDLFGGARIVKED